jgi:NAD(P)-dependent dehydrogenase (short-subunit alcohol dehydrogenase family)
MPADLRLAGQVALVTGAGRGIGQAIASAFAAAGARVVVADVRVETAENTAREIDSSGARAIACEVDVASPESQDRLFARVAEAFGRLDILVNNAGIFPRHSLEETTPEALDEIMNINFKGAFFCCKHAIPAMVQGGGGSVVNMGSLHGLLGSPNLVAYAASKGALLNLTKTLAAAYARRLVRVNYVIPGWVISEGEIRVQAQEGHDEQWLQETGKRMPMGRIQEAQDAANAVLFLASDEASQVTGAVLNTDGGSSVFRGRG